MLRTASQLATYALLEVEAAVASPKPPHGTGSCATNLEKPEGLPVPAILKKRSATALSWTCSLLAAPGSHVRPKCDTHAFAQ